MKVMKIKSGNILYFEDTPADSIYVIKSGKLYLRKGHEEYYYKHGELTAKIILGAGDMFGFREVFLGIKREARAVAMEETELIIFDIKDFSNFLKKNVKISKRVLSSLSNDIREASNRIKRLSDDHKQSHSGSGRLYDIYLYFLKENHLSSAKQVLERMIVNDSEGEFANAEIKRLEEFIEFEMLEITEEALNKIKDVYKNFPEVLEYLLSGLKQTVMENSIMEALLFEIITLKRKAKKLKTSYEELEEFTRSFPNSPKFKEMMFLLVEVYHQRKEFTKAYQISQSLSEADLNDDEKERFKEMVNFLKKVISRKGGE